MYILVIGIMIVIILILSAILIMYKQQINSLIDQLKFIANNDTNIKLTSKVVPFNNINKLVKNTNELIESHRKLELELKESNESFKNTITNISHDLRTPLTSVNGYIQLINDTDISADKKKEYIQIIQKRIKEVKKMLDQLFEYARIENNSIELENNKINITNILLETISEFYNDFTSKGIKPEIDVEKNASYIIGDKDALRRVFQNILNNAIVHGDGDIDIEMKKNKDKIRLEFSNKTHTISKSDINHLFERFYTTDKSRSKKTTGLGLSIAKNFVEKMNGNIRSKLKNEVFRIIIEFKEA